MARIDNPQFTLDRVKSAFKYYAGKGVAPMQSIIRVENALVDGRGSYSFNLKKDKSLLGPAEVSMDQWDLFIATHLFIGFRIDAKAKPGMAPMLTYAMLGDSANNTSCVGFKTPDAEALYNGVLSIMTNNVANLENFPLSLFKFVPQTQADGATVVPEFNISDVAVQTPEQFVFSGNAQHNVKIDFPVEPTASFAADAATPSDYEAKVVLEVYGYNIKGGAAEAFREAANPLFGRF